MDDIITDNTGATEATTQQNQETSSKTYSQEEFDNHMARMRKSIESKYERQFQELGDIEELRTLKTEAEKRKQEEQIKRGEFEKTLQELAAKKDAEIQRRDQIITEYKVNSPLLDAAAKHKAVAPEQVKALLSNRVRLGESGEVEVLDNEGNVRYDDSGKLLSVDTFVKEFLDTNPHFVSAGAANTNTRSTVSPQQTGSGFDLNSLDLTKPEHRRMYKEARNKGLV